MLASKMNGGQQSDIMMKLSGLKHDLKASNHIDIIYMCFTTFRT